MKQKIEPSLSSAIDQSNLAADALVSDVYALGRSWATYGLTVGKLAVEQSARTLEHTAKLLDNLAAVVAKKEIAIRPTPNNTQDTGSEAATGEGGGKQRPHDWR